MSQEDKPERTRGIVVGRVPGRTSVFYVGLNGDHGSRVEGPQEVVNYLRTLGKTFRDENLGVEPIFRGVGKEDEALFRMTRLELIAERLNEAPSNPTPVPLIS